MEMERTGWSLALLLFPVVGAQMIGVAVGIVLRHGGMGVAI